ncbi:MAG: bifunctional ADP-dependent NAD(P)H-hydrate dehydratase/NAD(P)H-hydrate epimerase [Acidimicrobiia bacterium]|nr:MAG: bifunctional ADP-dependent NAD(P)H-hydrate dehydratase/NAD(P)H-hydrate epimerase [Acidimicrobiia bacterium]
MRPIITPAESARLDTAATEAIETLMERAGFAIAVAAAEMGVGYGHTVTVLAGRGNNGGDGYVAAKYLARRGAQVTVRSLGFPTGVDSPARKAATTAVRAGVTVLRIGRPEPADLVIDALFGVGFRGKLADEIVPWTKLEIPVLAVDVPSGIDATTGDTAGAAFTADVTVTFQAAKTGHFLGQGPDRSGVLRIVDIGLDEPRAEFLLCEASDAPLPVRQRRAHKWSAGSVAVVGGSPGITGAAMLAARSALRAGAGAASIVCAASLVPIYAALDPGVMAAGVGDSDSFRTRDVSRVLEVAGRYDVLVVGPGLGPVDPEFVEGLLAGWDGPLVLDADGINALDGVAALASRTAPSVITPHAGEFARLSGEDASYHAAERLADKSGTLVLLKGSPTFVTDGTETWAVTTGGPELATIGTGDVLAGMLGAFIAGGLPEHVAARSAAYHHGVAGSRLAKSGTVIATDLVDEIGRSQEES